MHFSTSTLALLAIAAGVQAAHQEPPAYNVKAPAVQGTGVGGVQPGPTGAPAPAPGPNGNGNGTVVPAPGPNGNGNGTVVPAPGPNGQGGNNGTVVPGPNGGASPSATGYTPSSPGAKISVPQLGMLGTGLGSVAYGAILFLA
ncbi:Glycine-rich cell wall structural protein 1 [Penicillium diatomitis]|uniref:Glycine-rich cell wall structural protein 1 n=1 Tax=Penicillium diatomitis TaxID=2819901 RepID=A0A9W9WTH4_9EURO|nr:Glycine-rich cell wall structural protein 1 [Penicillium diatomitis]KAJ5475173.1 Glycine-rich cell wall structural protein 1 [Penicillium diatomitis]